MSRFEDSLLRNLSASNGMTDSWCAKLAWAAYQARVGKVDLAKEALISIRNECANHVSARIYSRINYVEGLCEFFSVGVESAVSKLLRARAIAVGCDGEDDVASLVNVWLASIYKNIGRWDEVLKSMSAAASTIHVVSHEVRFRLCLIVGDIYEEIEDYKRASAWYSLARDCALIVGDEAALSAMLYNRAAIRIYNLRLRNVGECATELNDGYIALEAASAQNYTHYVDDNSLGWSFDLMRGQLLLLKGDVPAAFDHLTTGRVEAAMAMWPEVKMLREADIFRCRVATGWSFEEAPIKVAESLVRALKVNASPGNRAIAAHSIAIGIQPFDPEYSQALLNISKEQQLLVARDRSEAMEVADRFLSLFGNNIRHCA